MMVTIIAAFLATLINIIESLNTMAVVTLIIGCILYIFKYLFGIEKYNQFSKIGYIIFIVFIATPAIWIFNDGYNGPIPLYIIFYSSVIAGVFRDRRRIYLFISLIIVTVALGLIQFYNIIEVVGYTSKFDKFEDIIITMVTALVFNYLFFDLVSTKQKISESIYRVIFNLSDIPLLIVDDNSIIMANKKFELLSGSQVSKDLSIHNFIKDEVCVNTKDKEVIFTDVHGNTKTVLATSTSINGSGKSILSLVDISAYKNTEKFLYRVAKYDLLTKLPNKISCGEVFYEGGFSVFVIIDIENLRTINLLYSREVGDRLLVDVANYLTRQISKPNFVSRLSGDEFCILIKTFSVNETVIFMNRLKQEIQEDSYLVSEYGKIQINYGIVEIYKNADLNDVILLGEIALSKAKEDSINKILDIDKNALVYDAQNVVEIEKGRVIILLKNAIRHNNFSVYYQPICDYKSKDIIYVEALVRLKLANEILYPAVFIRIAEKYGLITNIDILVFKTIVEDVKINVGKSVFMNISAQDLNSQEFLSLLVENSNTEYTKRLGFEFSENVLELGEEYINKLANIHNLGYKLAISNFGNNKYIYQKLKNVPVDYIKIDEVVIQNMDIDKNLVSDIMTIIEFAHLSNKKVIVQSIESSRTLKIVENIGIDYVQGYSICRPKSSLKELNSTVVCLNAEYDE